MRNARYGTTISIGAGIGAAEIGCGDCKASLAVAPVLSGRIGGAVRPDLILGGEVRQWRGRKAYRPDEYFTFVMANAQWFPRMNDLWFLDSSLGFTTASQVVTTRSGLLAVQADGFGASVGGG